MDNLGKKSNNLYTHSHYREQDKKDKFDLGRRIYEQGQNDLDKKSKAKVSGTSPLKMTADIKGHKIGPPRGGKVQQPEVETIIDEEDSDEDQTRYRG